MFKSKTHRRTPSVGLVRGFSHPDSKLCRGNPSTILVMIVIVGSCWLVADYWKTQAHILNYLRLMHVNTANQVPVNIWTSTQHARNATVVRNKHNRPVLRNSKTRAVYLVKVHRAASTTLQTILNRYATKHKLKAVSFNSPFGMPYPKVASKLLLYEDPVQAKFQPYDILHEHAIFDEKTVEAYMRPGYRLIGSIREPLAHIRSLFSSFDLPKRYGIGNVEDYLETFLENPELYKDKPRYHTLKNCQAQHYGYRLYKSNNNISAFIEHIDNRFDMILVSEKLDESLLLMKRKLSWSLNDIMYLSRHGQPSNPTTKMSQREQIVDKTFRSYSNVDFKMHEYFSQKLNRELANQTNIFWQQLNNFRSIKKNFNTFCHSMCDVVKDLGTMNTTQASHLMQNTVFHVPGTLGEKDVTLTYKDCVLLTMSSMNWQIAIKVKQFPHLFCSAKTRTLNDKTQFYDPRTETTKEDHQGGARGVSSDWCNRGNYLIDYFPSRTVFLDLFTKTTTMEQPFCAV